MNDKYNWENSMFLFFYTDNLSWARHSDICMLIVFNNNKFDNDAICREDSITGFSRLATCLCNCTFVPLSPQACNVHSHVLLVYVILAGYVIHAISSSHYITNIIRFHHIYFASTFSIFFLLINKKFINNTNMDLF